MSALPREPVPSDCDSDVRKVDADLPGFIAWQRGLEGRLPVGSGVVPFGGPRLRGSPESLLSSGGTSFRNEAMSVLDVPTRFTVTIGWIFEL